MAMSVTTETKAVLEADMGRVIGLVKGSEPGRLSLAVPGDRAVLTPREARELAAWLNDTASALERGGTGPSVPQWIAGERRAQDALLRNLR